MHYVVYCSKYIFPKYTALTISMKIFLPLFAMVLLAVGGCARIATPVDVHTQYVANVLVSPACLSQCDQNGDGLIQYRLWPGTETPSIQEPGAIVYGITQGHGPLSDEVLEKDKKIEKELAADDPETDPYAEYRCWQQCSGPQPGMVMAAEPAISAMDDEAMQPVGDSASTAEDSMMDKPKASAEAQPLPY